MSKKNSIVLGLSFLAVAAFYFYLYRDSFRKQHIQISHTIRPTIWALTHPASDGGDQPRRLITFVMGQNYALTSVKVISVAELATNKYAHPVWELVTKSNSPPMKAFSYGLPIHGMYPPVKDEKPAELDLNVPYRVLVEAGSIKGQHDFSIPEDDRASQ